MKKYTVYVYHWPADPRGRAVWLGYTRYDGCTGKQYVGKITVEAETRQRAITKGITAAKERLGGMK